MRMLALFIFTCALAYPAYAQQPKGVTACRVESVNQTNGITVIIDPTGCKDTTVTSTGQTGGITAGYVGTVTQDSGPKPKTIALCRTADVLDITVRGKILTVRGGRICQPAERPTVVLDTSTFAIVGGFNTGVVNMTIK